MYQQVTDVIGPMRSQASVRSKIPLWLKIAWTAWVLVWSPIYFKQYGVQNFLFFCDLGNILITLALWLESSLIFSWQAVSLLVVQVLYSVDLFAAFFFGRHLTGGTEYMFDPNISLPVRILGLYHLIVPPLLLWAVRRLGYDHRAFKLQTVTACFLIPICSVWRPQFNVNWARGLGHEQHLVAGPLYVIAYLAVASALIYWPTHLFLSKFGTQGLVGPLTHHEANEANLSRRLML
jgi:hypothetical protein